MMVYRILKVAIEVGLFNAEPEEREANDEEASASWLRHELGRTRGKFACPTLRDEKRRDHDERRGEKRVMQIGAP